MINKKDKFLKISFKTKLFKIEDWTLLRFPESASSKLTSRGLVIVEGVINGKAFKTALEPDGKGSHWFRVDKEMRVGLKVGAGDTVSLEVEQTNEWPEPSIPTDIKKSLSEDSKVNIVWKDITPLARWEWIRWISSTKNEETRKKRIEVAKSKLRSGKRRPCCFNTSQCSVTAVSHNGILLDLA